jgi:hypothetical protein
MFSDKLWHSSEGHHRAYQCEMTPFLESTAHRIGKEPLPVNPVRNEDLPRKSMLMPPIFPFPMTKIVVTVQGGVFEFRQ